MGACRSPIPSQPEAATMSGESLARRLSKSLARGNVADDELRELAALTRREIPAFLEQNMLMILSDTDSDPLRNILALTLARADVKAAAPRILHLLTDPKTEQARGTLLYALQQLGAVPDLI